MRVAYGTYTGNGSDNRSITGVGFQPTYVLIANAGSVDGANRYASESGDESFQVRDYDPGSTNWPVVTNRIQGFEADGFQVGTDDSVNSNGVVYYWMALYDDGGANIFQSNYTGNGSSSRNITGSGFDPDFVLTKGEWEWSGAGTLYHDGFSGDKSLVISGGGFTPDDRIQSLITDGFNIGANEFVNQNTYEYHYLTLLDEAGVCAIGAYTGNGSDARAITGLGFQPDIVIIFNDANSTDEPVMRTASHAGDNTTTLTQDHGTQANQIESLDADGFTVGTDGAVNTNTEGYYYIAFKSTEGAVAAAYSGRGIGRGVGRGIMR